MKRSAMPPRKTPLTRGVGLTRSRRKAAGRGAAAIDIARTAAGAEDALETVARILAGEITVAQAARESGYDEDVLHRLAWGAAKAAVFARDAGKCLACERKACDAQHRVARGMGGTDDPVIAYGLHNLIAMCRPCHSLAEARDMDMHRMGYWLFSWEDPALVPVLVFSRHGARAEVWLLPDGTRTTEVPDGVAA